MNGKFKDRTPDQLQSALAELKELLEEVLEEKKIWLCNTTVHVPGHKARQYEREIKSIMERIQEIESEIQNRREQ